MVTKRLKSGESWDYDAVFKHVASFLKKKYKATSLKSSSATDRTLLRKVLG